MKKKLSLLFASFLCLTGLTGIVSCEREPLGPGGNKREVNVQFVLNVSTTASATKQATNEVQVGTAPFRGISDARLMTLAASGDDGQILYADHDMDRVYDLSSMLMAGTISSSNSRRVLEMSLPLGTNKLVFYGKAPVAIAGTDGFTREDCYGLLDEYFVNDKAGKANFQLGKRLQEPGKFLAAEKLMAGILTNIMNTKLSIDDNTHESINASDVPVNGSNTFKFDLDGSKTTLDEGGYPQISWSSYAGQNSPVRTEHTLFAAEEKLSNLYKQLTTVNSEAGELRAASGEATLKIIQDLWSVINSVRCCDPTDKAEAVAKYFAVVVHQHLMDYFSAASIGTAGEAVTGVTFQSISTLINEFNSDPCWPNTTKANEFKPSADELTSISGISNVLTAFPGNFNIPRGAAYMAFNTEGLNFYYPQEFNVSAFDGTPGSGVKYNANNYYYPAELLYYGNSPLRASTTEHQTNDYPATTSAWNIESNWSSEEGWVDTHVKSSTRAVAMKYDINYGVAMLETKVGYAIGTLKDNNHAVQKALHPSITDSEEPDQTIVVNDGSFKLTGIIIGGQPQNVGWDFLPRVAKKNEDEDELTIQYGFIYDRAIHTGATSGYADSQSIPGATTETSNPNYTVVFDNYRDGAETQDNVFVALEFQNTTGRDFFGNFNLIKNGGYFYLIGKLDPTQANTGITWPASGHVVPPYHTSGENIGKSKQVTRIFVQDYMTTATFKFHENSLKSAYLTVPDLRASSLTLGLSVDIEWKQGLVYNDVNLGAN